jgi:hypothetical protein
MLVKERAMEKHALVTEEEFRKLAGQFLVEEIIQGTTAA